MADGRWPMVDGLLYDVGLRRSLRGTLRRSGWPCRRSTCSPTVIGHSWLQDLQHHVNLTESPW